MQDANRLFAVIDTNVVVSSLFSQDGTLYPAQIITAVLSGIITLLYNEEILAEYQEVLSRSKFPFTKEQIDLVISAFKDFGESANRADKGEEVFPDPDDIVYYALSSQGVFS